MTKKRVILFGVILFLLGSVAAFYRAGAVSAVPVTEQRDGESISKPLETDIRRSAPAIPETTKEKLAARDEVELSAREVYDQLNQKALTATRSGWLHGREHRKYDIDAPNFGVHPNGMAIPTEEETDFWFYFNDEGFIERSVTIVRNMDGQVVQAGIYSNGTSWNTATNEIRSDEMFPWGYGFDYGLHYYLDNPDLTWSNSSDQNDKPVTTFTIRVQEDKPAVVEEFSSPILAMDHYYYFDTETGFLSHTYSIAHLENGSQRIFEDIRVEFSTGVTPPPDVLAYFEQKLEREGGK